jgi:ribonuclease R
VPSSPKLKRQRFPSKKEILSYIQENPNKVGKRDIARAFGLIGSQRVKLKDILRDMKDEGLITQGRGRRFAEKGTLPEVTVLIVIGPDKDGDVLAKPKDWDDEGEPPLIYLAPHRQSPGPGDLVLAKLKKQKDGSFQASVMHRIVGAERRDSVLGVFKVVKDQGRLHPTDRRQRYDFFIARGDHGDAKPGELVRAEIVPGKQLGLRQARVLERLGEAQGAKSVSLIALHERNIPIDFTDGALAQAEKAKAAPDKGRDDLRKIPLVTIDGADARDFDDAVWAEPDEAKNNPGGWHLIVAIADVAWYVRPGDNLDRSSYERGNSVYFPDRVVPMLPEVLSNGWCSLRPNEDRPCLAAHMWIDANGRLLKHKFIRATLRSAARLTYEQVQAARDGNPDDATGPLMESVIIPLYGAYEALLRDRSRRSVLELDLPERQIHVDEEGTVTGVSIRSRFDSHKLIEEFMIAANVAAAETLEKQTQPCMYRIHNEPSMEKLEALREFLDGIGINFAKGQKITPDQFNSILKKVADTPNANMVNSVVLRSQSQAEYSPNNIGHFGLALHRYCHFTSPIRRYSDLLVHRALIEGGGLGDGSIGKKYGDFENIGEHLSDTERRAAQAERDAVDRFSAAFLADRVGAEFTARINGVTRFGLFITLEETGADGLIPIRDLPDDYYIHDEAHHMLRGRQNKREFRLGQTLRIVLIEATPLTGVLIFRLSEPGAAHVRKQPPRGKLHKKSRGKSKASRRHNRSASKK